MDIIKTIAHELGIANENYIENVVRLMDEGNTLPFIARYRKELHGGMDDATLRALETRLNYLRNLEKRREEVKNAIGEQGKLSIELADAIDSAATLSELEDLYRPYKQKRRTRATVAREKGLQPLAELILEQGADLTDISELAAEFINPELDVSSVEEALSGASDIIAETISDSAEARKLLREMMMEKGYIQSAAASDAGEGVYSLYYDFFQPCARLQGHQILAMNRGEKEGVLKISIVLDEAVSIPALARMFIKPGRAAASFVRASAEDSYKRLLFPSLEREVRNMLTDSAAEGAIKNFAANLRPLLMQPPVKGKVTLGYDPGYRHGCKLAVVDGTGKVLDTAVIYPTQPFNKVSESKRIVSALIKKHGVTNIAIGNGTASRESEAFIAELLKEHPGVSYIIVNEAGASVYSASKTASEEFPDFDVNLRSAVSIARRLQDPLAELVKIDPKAIGVGQYQHDMPQAELSNALTGVVESCVNSVGADLNTASPSLLSYISGLSKVTAKNIVAYREENGIFKSRAELLKVKKLGPKAYEQCAGFLRIPESENVLDNTAVHPESYDAAKRLLKTLGYTLSDVSEKRLSDIAERAEDYGMARLAKTCSLGLPTMEDIITELQKPGRDVRDDLPKPVFRRDVMDISDLAPGMVLTGVVRNVIDFGAFVDIGVHQDGLVHISQICDKFIRHPSEVLTVGDTVKVVVTEVSKERKRIGLSIRQAQ